MAQKLKGALLGAALVLGTIALPAAATAVPAAPAPARATTGVVVDSHDLEAAGLFQFRDRCSTFATSTPPEPDAYGMLGGSSGTHAIGWQYPFTDFEVGALAAVPEPTALTEFSEDVYSPSGHASGHVVAFYYDGTAGYTDGYWVGFSGLDHEQSGWATHDVADQTLVWSYFESGYSETNVHSATVRQFATQRGGDGFGAWVGLALGCDGEQFFIDRLRVGSTGDATTYDFEGVPTLSHLEWSKDGRTVHDGKFRLAYHQKVWMLGHSHGRTGGMFTGPGTLWAKTFGSSRFHKVATREFDPTYYAGFKLSPKRRTDFRFSTSGSPVFDTSISEKIRVEVRAAVRAKVQDRTLRQGQRLVVRGQIKPGNKGVKVGLERRLNGRWTTLASGRTHAHGAFGLGVRARTPGTWKVRVTVATGKGNLGNRTKSVDVVVKRSVPPPPDPADDPAAPPDVVTPAPPPPPGPAPDPTYRRHASWPSVGPTTSMPACAFPGPYLVPCAPGASGRAWEAGAAARLVN